MIRLAVKAPADRAELVLAELLELAPTGVEQIDHGEVTEFAIYGAPGEVPDLGGQRALVGGVEVEVHASEVGDDWHERWKQFHRPVLIGGRICVRPPWAEPAAGLEDIVIDPGRAFGTAAHPTTRMSAELLFELADRNPAGGPLVDLGTGSGVLAIIAARLGWNPVIAVDHEFAAIEAAEANANANGVQLDLRRIDLRRQMPPPAPVVVANLTADLLVLVAGWIAASARLPRDLICSGLLPEQADAVEHVFWSARLTPLRRLERGGWAALSMSSADRGSNR